MNITPKIILGCVVSVIVVVLIGITMRSDDSSSPEPEAATSVAPEEVDAREWIVPESTEVAVETITGATMFGHQQGLSLEEQNERREPELIENVPAEVIEYARVNGFPFEGTVIRVVREHGFILVAHDPVDSYMWAAESRPIHPADPALLLELQPGDKIRGRVYHGEDRYVFVK